MFHIVYYSYEEGTNGRGYVGKHSCEMPYDNYLGSFRDKTFNPVGKIILEYAKTEEGALGAEIRWQKILNVVENSHFANQAYQSSQKFQFIPTTKGDLHQNHGKKIYHNPDTGAEKRFASHPGSNWVLGRPPKFKEKMSQVASKRRLPEEVKQKISRSNTGKKKGWWVNSEGKTASQENCPGPGWVRGRRPKGKNQSHTIITNENNL